MVEWTDETVALLRELWGRGMSGGAIGVRMGATRNAIIGKAHRIGLSRPPKLNSVWPSAAPKPRVARSPAPKERPPEIIETPPVAGGVSIVDLEPFHCRAIIGNGDDGRARFCGASAAQIINRLGQRIDTPYCRSHARKYYQ